MDQAQAKPIARRRRLIVASVFVLLLTASWWHWPRGDARFVGKWALRDVDTAFPAEFVQFHANGMMKLSGRSDFRNGHWTPWTVKGTSIETGYDLRGTALLSGIIKEGLHAINGRSPFLVSSAVFEFQMINADAIEIRSGPARGYTLHRIPE
jgi:hypothetical protein